MEKCVPFKSFRSFRNLRTSKDWREWIEDKEVAMAAPWDERAARGAKGAIKTFVSPSLASRGSRATRRETCAYPRPRAHLAVRAERSRAGCLRSE